MQTGVGLTVTLRTRLRSSDARGAGEAVDDASVIALFGEVASELLIRLDGDQGVLRAYDAIEFVAPVRVGDYLEVTGVITKVGQTSRVIVFEARKVVESRRSPELAASAADALAEPLAIARAIATCVVPLELQRRPRIVLPALSAPPPDVAELPEPRPVITPAPRVIVTPANTEVVLIAAIGSSPDARRVADEAARCRDAGAAGVELSGPAASPDVIAAVRSHAEVLVQVGVSGDQRADFSGARPDLVTLVCGSVNRDDGVLQNPRPWIRERAAQIRAIGARATLECWDAGHLDEAAALAGEGLLATPLHFQFVVGMPGGIGAREEVVRFMASQLPARATWAIAAPAPHTAAMTEVALRLGGHVRVTPQAGSEMAAMVARAAELARSLGRVVVDPDRARQLFGLTTV
jgi:3-keto-5-aminohexanoate cleavage enzyme